LREKNDMMRPRRRLRILKTRSGVLEERVDRRTLSLVRERERLRCARAICIGCLRGVLLLAPDKTIPVWHHEGYPWRCDAALIHELKDE